MTCEAHAERFNDLSYCFRCDTRSIADRQKFIRDGILWKQMKPKPFDNLRVDMLWSELQNGGVDTAGQLCHELDDTFKKFRKGIVAFPALLLPSPEQPLDDLNLQHYEVCSVEPLHDFKGDMANPFTELSKVLKDKALDELEKVKACMLKQPCDASTTEKQPFY